MRPSSIKSFFSSAHFLTFLSATLIVFSFPTWNLYPLIWVALVPWFFALKKSPHLKDRLIQGVALSFWVTLGGFSWVAYSIQHYGNLPWSVSILGLLLFALGNQPQFIAFSGLYPWFESRSTKKQTTGSLFVFLFFMASLYTVCDGFLPKLFLDSLGHSFYLAKNFRQLAELSGVSLLTFLIVLHNLALFYAIKSWKGPHKKTHRLTYGSVLGILILAEAYGTLRYQQIQKALEAPQATISFAVIQANIGDLDKVAAESGRYGVTDRILGAYFRLSQEALTANSPPHAIVWPETAYPSAFGAPRNATEQDHEESIQRFVETQKRPLLFGGYSEKQGKDYNSLFIFTPEKIPEAERALADPRVQVYRKNALLPFAEYIPLAESPQWAKDLFPQMGFFGRGPGPEVFPIRFSSTGSSVFWISPVICYEALIMDYVLEGARKGSQMILNVTNDSWFGPYGEPYLHLALVTFRSIETRLPQLRSTNTGISTLIMQDGEITQPTPLFQEKVLQATVPLLKPEQVFKPTVLSYGNSWLIICVLLVLFLGFSAFRKKT